MGWFGLSRQEEKYWGRIRKGDAVEVTPRTFSPRVYRSQVERVGAREFDVRMPQHGAAVMEAAAHPVVMVRVYTDFGIVRFKTKVLSAQHPAQVVLTLSKPRSIVHLQLRQFYRLRTELLVKYGSCESLEAANAVVPVVQAVTRDISEGGMLLCTSAVHAPGTFLKLLIHLAPDISMPAVAVVRLQRKAVPDDRMLTSLQFVNLSEKDRDAIRRFVLTHSIPCQIADNPAFARFSDLEI